MKFPKTVKDGETEYFLFKPKPWKLFLVDFQKTSVLKKIRYFLAMFRGSFIYYMKINGETVGYCLLEHGRGRCSFIPKKDYVISPYVISREHRNKGYGTHLLLGIKSIVENNTDKEIYGIVQQKNIGSQKALSNAGFRVCGYCETKGITKKYVFDKEDNTKKYIVFKTFN